MNIFNIKNLLFYGGIEKNEYKKIKNQILLTNRTTAMIFSIFALCLIAVMFFLSVFMPEFSNSSSVYLIGVIVSLVIYLLALFGKQIPILISISFYLAEFFYMTYGLALGLITRSDQQTTTFMVMLILLPLIFIDRPIITDIIMFVFITVFCAGAYNLKADSIKYVDIVDAIIFGLLSIASGTTIIRVRIKEFILEHDLKRSSETDILTGLKNRNSYERKLKLYNGAFNDSIACIYFDVNGLHALNNSKGHEAGDQMLQYIAQAIQSSFGLSDTFRIGGDEYVVIVKDMTYLEMSNKLNEIIETIEDKGYHVAIGYELQFRENFNMDSLIKTAEQNMYDDKEEYYKNHNRRGR